MLLCPCCRYTVLESSEFYLNCIFKYCSQEPQRLPSREKIYKIKMEQKIELGDPTLVRSLRGHKQSISVVAFHPGCRYVASAGKDNSILLHDLYNQARYHKFTGHKSEIHDLKFSPNGNMIVSVSKDETMRFWEVNQDSEREDVSVKAHAARVRGVAFSCDGLLVASCADDKLIKVWSAQDKRLQFTLKGHNYWARGVEFSPTAVNLASCDDKNVLIWDIATKRQIQEYSEHTGVIHSVKFHKLGNCIASCSHDKKIKIYDLRTQKVIQTYEAHKGPVTSIDFHPYSASLLSTSDDGATKIWDLKKGALAYTLNCASESAVFSRHGDFFLTAGGDKLVNVWRTGYVDSGRQHIDGPGAQRIVQEEGERRGPSVEKGPARIPQSPSSMTQRNAPANRQSQDHYQLEKENLRSLGNKQIIYDHRAEEHFELAETNREGEGRGSQRDEESQRRKTLIPEKLASKLRGLTCQLDFITKTVQVLEARVVNNEEQLSRLRTLLN